jgi:hypothetical protein
MPEHIKTGLEIADECVRGFTKVMEKPSHEDWVSISWLKKEINKRIKEVKKREGTLHVGPEIQHSTLDWVLSLLEEKQ